MTENRRDILTIPTMRTDFQADYILLLGQETEKNAKVHSSHILKFLLASSTNGTLAFDQPTSRPFVKAKEPFFINA